MRILAVVPDGNVLDIVRWAAQWNHELEWDIVTVMPDAECEPVDWAKNVQHLKYDYRETCSHPQRMSFVPEGHTYEAFAYEMACAGLTSPLIGNWFHYDVWAMLFGKIVLENNLADRDYDILVTWGERGWYNETAIGIARKHNKPVCRLERATFPGMLVADGTGLEQGRCDLAGWHKTEDNHWGTLAAIIIKLGNRFPDDLINEEYTAYWDRRHWLSVAPWQGIESQPRTTLGMVQNVLDGRPSVFVPLQVPVDTNMIFRTGNIHNNYGLLEYVAEKYPDHQVLVKKHPSDGFTCPEKLQSYCDERGFNLVNMATHAVLQCVDQVVSINSQCIIEAWMHDTPVEILGQPAFDLPEEEDKESLLYTLRFAYYIEPWQLTERLKWISSRCA